VSKVSVLREILIALSWTQIHKNAKNVYRECMLMQMVTA